VLGMRCWEDKIAGLDMGRSEWDPTVVFTGQCVVVAINASTKLMRQDNILL
jgi:hypothetical protein